MLSYTEIRERITNKEIVITPLLDPEVQIQQGGIDLRLGNGFIVPRRNLSPSLDPVEHARSTGPIEKYQERLHIPFGTCFIIHPGEIVLGVTIEYVVLPDDVFGMIVGRSSYGRLGLTIATAVKISPGNKACITLELVNGGHLPIKLYPGTRIGQIILMHIADADHIPMRNRYQIAIGPEFSKLHEDKELRFLSQDLLSSNLVIGITGTINSGKSRVARILAESLQLITVNPMHHVSAMIAKEQEKRPRVAEDIYRRKLELRSKSGSEYLAKLVFRDAITLHPSGIVIDGLTHPKEIKYLREHPNFRLVAVQAEDEWRWEQYREWNKFQGIAVSRQDFEETDKRVSTGLDLDGKPSNFADQIADCLNMADYRIVSGREDTNDQIDQILSLLKRKRPYS